MFGIRTFVIATIAMAVGTAAAQFDGPAPLAWRWQQPSSVVPAGTPLVDGNTIFFNLGNRVFAIDRETGNTKWKFPNGAPLNGILRKAPVLVNGVLVVYTDQKDVYGVNPMSGELKWLYQAPYQITSQPVALGNEIAFPMEGGNIMGVDTVTGQTIYPDGAYRVLDGIRGPMQSDGRDLVAFFDNKNYLQSVNIRTRKLAWRQNFGSTPPDGAMTMKDGYYYVYTSNFMACLNAFSGSVKWQVPLPERMLFSPEVGGGTILCVSPAGRAYVFDMAGQIQNARKPIDFKSQPAVRPTFVGKKFIVATANGSLNLVNPATSTVEWQYYVRPMNEAARTASSSSTSGSGGASPGLGGLGGPGGAQGGRPNSSTSSDPVTTVDIVVPVAIAGKTLLVPAADASLLAFDVDSGVDLVGPEVKQIWPGPGEILSGKSGQEFIFKVEDEASGINMSSVKLEIDGVPYNYEFGRDGYLICQLSTSKKNANLRDGRRTLRLTATDWMGNTTTFVATLRIDNTLEPLKRPGSDTKPPAGGGGPGGGFGGGDGAGLGGGGGFGGG